MNNIRLGRLGDNDKRYGPLTVSRKNKSDRKDSFFSYFYLETVTSEDDLYTTTLKDLFCNTITCHFSPIGSIRLRLPFNILKPKFVKVKAESWGEETIKRLGRDWYYDVRENRTGFNVTNTGFQFKLPGKRTVVVDWPWGIDHKETVYFDPRDGKPYKNYSKYENRDHFHFSNYLIRDYDGDIVTVSVIKVCRSYYRTKGILKWLRYLFPLKHYWSTDFNFSGETGAGKGSWKGGTIGSSILTDKKEPLFGSLKRYCDEHGMTVLGFIGYSEGELKKDCITEAVQKHLPIYLNLVNPTSKEV